MWLNEARQVQYSLTSSRAVAFQFRWQPLPLDYVLYLDKSCISARFQSLRWAWKIGGSSWLVGSAQASAQVVMLRSSKGEEEAWSSSSQLLLTFGGLEPRAVQHVSADVTTRRSESLRQSPLHLALPPTALASSLPQQCRQ